MALKKTYRTVFEYIRDRSIHHALFLLNTTDLQIQTAATQCGVMGVQYFSKVFKRQIEKRQRNTERRSEAECTGLKITKENYYDTFFG